MLKSKTRTKGRKYPRGQTWIERRNLAFERAGDTCEVSKEPLGFYKPVQDSDPPEDADPKRWHWRRACHHIFAERYVRRFLQGADPHILENLLVILPRIHSQITGVEWRLFSGDYIGYMAELRRIGVDQHFIDGALRALNANAREKHGSSGTDHQTTS